MVPDKLQLAVPLEDPGKGRVVVSLLVTARTQFNDEVVILTDPAPPSSEDMVDVRLSDVPAEPADVLLRPLPVSLHTAKRMLRTQGYVGQISYR